MYVIYNLYINCCRASWCTEDKSPSISSEESLTEYDEVDGLQRDEEAAAALGLDQRCRKQPPPPPEQSGQIWQERDIQTSLR